MIHMPPRAEKWHVACRNGVWFALTERGTSDAPIGVVVDRNGLSSKSLMEKIVDDERI